MATPEEIEEFKKKNARIAVAGRIWYEKLAADLEKKYGAGTFIAIDIATGSYVTGTSLLEVMDKTKQEFPQNAEFFVRCVVEPHPFASFAGCPQ